MAGRPGLPYDAAELVSPLLHHFRTALVHFEACFHQHYRRAVFLPYVVYVLYAVGDRLFFVRFQAGIEGPVRIERHSYHIPSGAVFGEGVEVAVVERLVEAIVEVDYHFCLREYGFHGIIAGCEEAGILLRVVAQVAYGFEYGHSSERVRHWVSPLVSPDRPEEAVGGFVSDLHPTRLYAVVLEHLQHVTGVFRQQLPYLFIAFPAPGGRDVLFLRVGPEVAVVEVYHYRHPEVARSRRLHQQVFAAVPVAVLRRVHPHPEAQRVQSEFFHQFAAFAPFAVFVVEILAVGFVFRRPAYIRAFPVVSVAAGDNARQRRQNQYQFLHIHR